MDHLFGMDLISILQFYGIPFALHLVGHRFFENDNIFVGRPAGVWLRLDMYAYDILSKRHYQLTVIIYTKHKLLSSFYKTFIG